MPNAHESTDPWPAPPQEDRSSPDPSSALQALQPLCFTQALFDNRSALEAVLAHLFTPSFEDFADFEDAELENDSDISAEPSVPAGWAATVMAIPDTLSPDLERALTALLPEETQHRLMRFTHPARRLQSLFGRLLAQRLANLASHAGQSPYHLREQPPEGPQLTDFSGVSVGRFAVAHTDGCVAVSLSRRAMGIDLEQPTRAQQTKRLVSLAEFAFGARFARTIAAASAVNLTRAQEAFGDDREPANDSPLTDEVLKKYARAREVELFWEDVLRTRAPDGSAVAQRFVRTPAGLLTLLGGGPADAPHALEWLDLTPEALLVELTAHRHAYV